MSERMTIAELELEMRDLAESVKLATIEACTNAAREGFESAMKDYVLIGPSGMAMRMINSIKALAAPRSPQDIGP